VLVDILGSSAVAEFYDGVASDYHLIYADRWEQSLRHQGRALDALIRSSLPETHDVLDCACGIGAQAIGLALLGYRVTATDISERSLQRARDTAARLSTPVTVLPADFRDLRGISGDFDVVICCDTSWFACTSGIRPTARCTPCDSRSAGSTPRRRASINRS